MKIPYFFFVFIFFSGLWAVFECSAKDLGTYGAVYPIVEEDLLAKIHNYISSMDKEKYILEAKNKARSFILNYKPSDLTRKLPAAKENNVFLVDLTYTLQFDIPDGKGGILYPKGYTFNPLEYAPLFIKTIVIIDGDRREQIDWFKASTLMKNIDVTLMLSGGSYHKVMKELKRPVFYASQRIIDRLGIKATPSVAVQQGKYFQIHEYLVTAEDTE